LLPARPGERVVLRPPIVLGGLPFRGEPTRFLEAMEGRGQRAGLDHEGAARDLFDAARDAEAVPLAGRERLQDQQVERALQQWRSLVLHRVLLSDVYMSERVGLFLSNVNRSNEQVSAQNRTVHCRHFGICGGCSVPGVPYAEQLRRKRERLAALLRLDVPPLVPSPRQDAFRQKA